MIFAILLFPLLIVCQHDLCQTLLLISDEIVKSVKTISLLLSLLSMHRLKDLLLHRMRLSAEFVFSRLLLLLVILNGKVLSEEVFRLLVRINSFCRFFVASTGHDQNFVWHGIK